MVEKEEDANLGKCGDNVCDADLMFLNWEEWDEVSFEVSLDSSSENQRSDYVTWSKHF